MRLHRTMIAALAALCLLGAAFLSSSAALGAEALETPATAAATGVTATTATLNGELNPGAGAAESEYRFLFGPGTECTGGRFAPEPPGVASGNHQAVSTEVTGLQPSTEYAFCLEASVPAEALTSPVATFTTSGLAPAVDSESTSGVTPFDAVLEAQVNPNNQETTYSFEYATNEALTGATTVPVPPGVLAGFGDQTASADIGGGLTSATTYYYKVIAANATGTTEGSVQSFTTLTAEAPIVEGESASGITSTSATLEGQVNPNYQETTYALEYGTGAEPFNAPTTVPGAGPLSGFGNQPVSFPLSGLTPNTVYSYRVVATNATGTTHGTGQTFHTPAQPAVLTGGSSGITRRNAALAGSVNPLGAATKYHFVYGTTAAYGASTLPVSAGEGFGEVAASASLEELQPGTTYHYALVATNAYGTVTGADRTFTTSPPTPPLASTGAASGVGHQSVTLSGSVDPDGLSTSYEFQLGTEAGVYYAESFGILSGSGAQAVTLEMHYLAPGVTYHYRLVATNQDGVSYGADQTFATEGYPNPFAAPAATLPVLSVPALAPESKVTSKPPAKKPVKKHKKKKHKKKKKAKKKH